jgi:RNA polymerase-binding transcription factor DksA
MTRSEDGKTYAVDMSALDAPTWHASDGVCVECAEPIGPARLHALPGVQTCVRCQADLDDSTGVAQTRNGTKVQ